MSVQDALSALRSVKLSDVLAEIDVVSGEIREKSAYLAELQQLAGILGGKASETAAEVQHAVDATPPDPVGSKPDDSVAWRHLPEATGISEDAPESSTDQAESPAANRGAQSVATVISEPKIGVTIGYGRVRRTIVPGSKADRVWQYLLVAGEARLATIAEQTGIEYAQTAGILRDFPAHFIKVGRGLYRANGH